MYLDINDTNNNVLHTFDSVSEFLTYANETPKVFSPSGCASQSNDVEFTGTPTFAQAYDMAFRGYPEARRVGEPLRLQFLDVFAPIVIKKKPRYEIVGDSVDIARHLHGLPDPFLVRYEPHTGVTELGKSKSLIRIGVNLTYTFFTSRNAILNRGAAICALIDLLELNNKRVEVLGVLSVSPLRAGDNSGHTLENILPLKEAGHALDIDFMYFCLAHPAMLRRFGFAVWETYPRELCHYFRIGPGTGYGRVCAPKNLPDCDIYFPHVIDSRDFRDSKTTKKWLADHLVKQGAVDAKDVLDI